jgi:hypothetical protein
MDINVIKKRREELNEKGGGNNVLFKPDLGKQTIRVVPYKHNEENPFTEVHWHYNINKKHFLCLKRNFGEDCPVCNLGFEMWQSEDKQDKELAKKLFANIRFYLPIIVRGKESEGVKFWAFGSNIYDSLTMQLDEVGDFTNVENGRDINITKKSPQEAGNLFGKTIVSYSFTSSPMLPDEINSEELMNKILNEQPEVFEMLENSHYDEEKINGILKDWFESSENEESEESNNNSSDKNEEHQTTSKSEVMSKFDELLNSKTDEK